MKRTLLSLILLLGILLPTAIPAQAVFGLSECEKIKKEMLHEESIGLLYFKDFAKQRKTLLQMKNPMRSNAADVLSWIGSVFQSDLKVYAFVEKNSKCFSAAQVIDARRRVYDAQQSASDASVRAVLYAYKTSDPISSEDLKFVKEIYPSFSSFFNPKKRLAS